jgi:hypothetical protein
MSSEMIIVSIIFLFFGAFGAFHIGNTGKGDLLCFGMFGLSILPTIWGITTIIAFSSLSHYPEAVILVFAVPFIVANIFFRIGKKVKRNG